MMNLELSSEDVVCLLLWYTIFKDNIGQVTETDKNLFNRVKRLLSLDKGVPYEGRGYSGIPKYQPGKPDVQT